MSECNETTEVFSRITGYFRPIENWNKGKQQEFKDRKTYGLKGVHDVLSRESKS